MAHELPALPYDYSALEPIIDAATMKLHHDMHHAAYVKNLNAALEKYPNLQSKSAEDLLRDLSAVPEDIRGAVRNNGGGHVNHSMFWKIMKPKGGGDPTGPIAEAITKAFGSFKDFQTNSKTQAQSSLVPDGHGLQANQAANCKCSAARTRTIPCLRACSPSWATMFGSMPII